MYYIPFSAMEQLGLIADNWWYLPLFFFFFPSSVLPCLLFRLKGCPCVETVINLFPITLSMTPLSAVKLGKHWTIGHDESEDIPKPPRAVYANACGFDREEMSCGICGFCHSQNCELFHSYSFPSTMELPLTLSTEKSDHCRQLKPRLSF